MKIFELFNNDDLNDISPGEYIKTNATSSMDLNDRDKIENLIKFIKENCSIFLDFSDVRTLYRGIKGENKGAIFLGNSRNDRRVKDSRPDIQLAVDTKLTELGFKALRSNSIYCTGSISTASVYGDIYAIFPIDGADYLWSETRYDLAEAFGGQNGVSVNNRTIEDFQEDFKFNNDMIDLERAIASSREILVHGKYIAISINHYAYTYINGEVRR